MSQSEPNPTLAENQHLTTETYQRLVHLEAVNKISGALRAALTLEEMLRILADETLRVIDAAAVTIWLYDPAKEELRQAAASGFPDIDVRLKPGEGIAGQVFVSSQPYISREFKTDPRTHESARERVPPGLAGAAIPIRTTQETVGVLFVSVLAPAELTADQVRLLSTIAEVAGIAIHRIRLHDLTEQRLQRLAALQTINMAVTASLDLQVTLNILLDQVITHLQADAADILLFDLREQTLDYAAGRGFRSAEVKHAVRFGEGIAGRAAIGRRVVIVPNLSETTSEYTRLPPFAEDRFVTCVAVPLLARGRIRGILEVFHRTHFDPNQEWLDFLQTLAESATIAIDNASELQDLGRSNNELELAYDATLESWARALDTREREPEGHAARVADLTVELARAAGIPTAQLIHVRRGALLHDVGKLSVPESILFKPGHLTAKEWAEMRKHPVYAYELLAPIAHLKPALVIPYCHHEKWDGTGYPNGLKGGDIPLEARIFAVADVWDALRSERPYRAAWPEAKALKRIQLLAGTHFDPQIVDVFLRLVAESK